MDINKHPARSSNIAGPRFATTLDWHELFMNYWGTHIFCSSYQIVLNICPHALCAMIIKLVVPLRLHTGVPKKFHTRCIELSSWNLRSTNLSCFRTIAETVKCVSDAWRKIKWCSVFRSRHTETRIWFCSGTYCC
jgi:hypothetical protein